MNILTKKEHNITKGYVVKSMCHYRRKSDFEKYEPTTVKTFLIFSIYIYIW